MMKHRYGDTIVIIGAGIAGLAAGCYAQMNGYQTQIFEMHDRPGGLCTAWHRQGFVFDGCIHYLFGSARGQPFYQLWEELGVVPQQQFVHHDELLRVSESDGKTLIIYSNPDRLEQHFKELSPIDRRLINEFCTGIRTFTRFDLSLLQQQPKALMQLGDWAKLARKMLPTNYDYWQRIYGRSIYDAEEIQESQILIALLEQFYPGIKDNIEFVDVATPLTYERYTGNWQGSSCGWLLTKQTLPLSIKGLPKTLPKLQNFYAIGQWVEPGGSVPVVAMSGRNIVQQICREDKRIFRVTTPVFTQR